MTKKDNQSPEDSKSTENNTEENKDLNTLSYEELLKKVADLEDEILRYRAELENFKKRTSSRCIFYGILTQWCWRKVLYTHNKSA